MRRAIISDIHANLEALEAVLVDIDTQRVDEIVCLGDVVGYGPNPRECIEKAMSFRFSLRGNHEAAVLFIAMDFNVDATQSIEWTRAQLNSKQYAKKSNHALWNFLGGLPESQADGGGRVLYVHGSPRMPTREYVRPVDASDASKMTEIFAAMEHVCFNGHTHESGIITEEMKFHFPQTMRNMYKIGPGKCLLNVGSVGQPRDRNPRASYVIFDGETVFFRRVDYDFRKTMRKISAVKELPAQLALRLKEGR
jgi:predicted phosphodiesterase